MRCARIGLGGPVRVGIVEMPFDPDDLDRFCWGSCSYARTGIGSCEFCEVILRVAGVHIKKAKSQAFRRRIVARVAVGSGSSRRSTTT